MSQRKQYQNLFTFVDHILISFAVRLGLRLRLLMPLSVASTDIFLLFTFIYFSRWGQALYLMHFYSIPFTCFPYKVSAVAAIVVYFLSPMLFCFKQFFFHCSHKICLSFKLHFANENINKHIGAGTCFG